MDEQQLETLFRYLGRHLVALCGVYVPVDNSGRPQGSESWFSASGFVIELDGTWYFITAGHVLGERIGDHINTGRVRLTHCSLADYFGRDAKNEHPTVISWDDVPKFHVDEGDGGLDIGVFQLRPLYVEGLKSNGVVAIPESQWIEGDATNEQAFTILGLPEEARETDPTDPAVGFVHLCIAGVTPCELPEDSPPPTHPLFVAMLNSNEPNSMVGFSGGPIFRLRPEAAGLRYWLHAVQARWRKAERITIGCPMTVVAQLIRERFPNTQNPCTASPSNGSNTPPG